MAISITVEEVNEFCSTGATDSKIQMYIDVVLDKYEACLESSYSAVAAKNLAMSGVCLMLENSNTSGRISSERAPNGASTSYDTTDELSGMKENIMLLDTNNCMLDLTSNGNFAFGTIGTNLNDCGCY